MKKSIAFIVACICITIASCNSKKYNNHIMNDSTDSSSLSAGKATSDSGTRLDTVSPMNTDTSGEQNGRMNNAPKKDTMGKKKK